MTASPTRPPGPVTVPGPGPPADTTSNLLHFNVKLNSNSDRFTANKWPGRRRRRHASAAPGPGRAPARPGIISVASGCTAAATDGHLPRHGHILIDSSDYSPSPTGRPPAPEAASDWQ